MTRPVSFFQPTASVCDSLVGSRVLSQLLLYLRDTHRPHIAHTPHTRITHTIHTPARYTSHAQTCIPAELRSLLDVSLDVTLCVAWRSCWEEGALVHQVTSSLLLTSSLLEFPGAWLSRPWPLAPDPWPLAPDPALRSAS